MKENSKRALEKVTIKATKVILEIVKVFDDHGADLSEEYAAKVFAHLHKAVTDAHTRAMASRATQLAVTGIFSLDAPIDAVIPAPQFFTPAPVIIAPAPAPQPTIAEITAAPPVEPAPTRERKWVKPEGRLAGTGGKEVVYPSGPKPQPRREAPEPGEVPDKTGAIVDAGFIES